MSLKKRNKVIPKDHDVQVLSEDEAFDAVLALNSASSSQGTSSSGFSTAASSSQASTSSRNRRSVAPSASSSQGTSSSGFTTAASSSQSSTSSGARRSVGSLEGGSKRKTNAEELQAKKRKKEEYKAAKAAALQKSNMYKPSECMKYMKIEIHPTLSAAWYMADVSREAGRAGCAVSAHSGLSDPALLMWTRLLQPSITVSDAQCGLITKERCDRALYITTADEVAEKVAFRGLSQHIAAIRDLSACKLTLVIFGVKDYFMSSGRKTNSKKLMTDIDLEMSIADLLVTADCDTVLADTPNELALLISQFTKAIAEGPYKRAKRAIDDQAQYFMRGDNKKCVRVEITGHGLRSLWQQMIAILPHSSLEISRAFCAQYPSPIELYEALQLPDSITTLADLPVSRSGVAGSRARRLGPEFARKMHTLFTAEDGNTLIE